jgi:hypothetical protein
MGRRVAVSVRSAAGTDDRREMLLALRDRLAAKADEVELSGTELAAVSRQLVLVTAEIAELTEPEELSVVDQLSAKRAARLAGTDAALGPAEKRQRRS